MAYGKCVPPVFFKSLHNWPTKASHSGANYTRATGKGCENPIPEVQPSDVMSVRSVACQTLGVQCKTRTTAQIKPIKQPKVQAVYHRFCIRSLLTQDDGVPQEELRRPEKRLARSGDSGWTQIDRKWPELRPGEEVLARWGDDGWYYWGTVKVKVADNCFIIRDGTGYCEHIARDNILTRQSQAEQVIQPGDHVVGLHPGYCESYLPGDVVAVYRDDSVQVRLCDGSVVRLAAKDVFRITQRRHKDNVQFIGQSDQQLIGQSVVARHDKTGLYKRGLVVSGSLRRNWLSVRWLDGGVSDQATVHLFDVGDNRKKRRQHWRFVLAPVNSANNCYLPGEIMAGGSIRLCNGNIMNDVALDRCFLISETYFKMAARYRLAREATTNLPRG